RHARRQDPFNLLGLDPLHEFKNVPLLSRFVTEMGRIRPRSETGLSTKNQRRLSKAIKRARAMGLMPFTYR
ncbi:ribosomal protein S18, partial [Syncephalis pseudoplumigaleata]